MIASNIYFFVYTKHSYSQLGKTISTKLNALQNISNYFLLYGNFFILLDNKKLENNFLPCWHKRSYPK